MPRSLGAGKAHTRAQRCLPFANTRKTTDAPPRLARSVNLGREAMLFSCADWLTVDPAMLQHVVIDDDASGDSPFGLPTRAHMQSAPCKSLRAREQSSRTLSASVSNDTLVQSPRSFQELQRGSLSLRSSIEEFNAIIDADLNGDGYWSADSAGAAPQQLGARFFASAAASSSIEYGWTPFQAGEFQFARHAPSSSSSSSSSQNSCRWSWS